MKNITQLLFASIVMGMISCHTHDEFLSPHQEVTVDFDSTLVTVLENEDEEIIQLSFNRITTKNGVLILAIPDATQSRFTTEPPISNGQIILTVGQNQESATLKIKPVNNSLSDGNLEFTVSVTSTTAGFTVGARNSVSMNLQDDEAPVQGKEVTANFIQATSTVAENGIAGTCSITFSEKLTGPGSVEISLASTTAVYGIHYTTIPVATNGKIILLPAIGESKTNLTIIPVDNSTLAGELKITLAITGTSGAILKGSELNHSIIITDDELTNRPKGYESSGGSWELKKTFEYDAMGRVKYVNLETSTPTTSRHTETYFYNGDGTILKINTYPQIDRLFTWANERITKSETIDHGLVKAYIDYDYDIQGNVSGTANYFRQPDGQFKLGFITIYLYFVDGNLYKSQTYIPDGSDELLLISTRTYDQYLDAENPFPMVDILPTVKTQTKLPSVYIVEENGVTLTYTLTYEFREDGLVSKRFASRANTTETTHYLYY